VRSRIRTSQNNHEWHGIACESQFDEHRAKEEMGSCGTSAPSGDVLDDAFVTGETSPGNSSKISSDDSSEGKDGIHKILSSKAEAFLAKKGISWPWRGLEQDGADKSHIVSQPFNDIQENNLADHRAPEAIITPDCQDIECVQESKYEVTGSWWSFNNNSTSSVSSTLSLNSSAFERLDHEADCLDYEILWEDLVIGEQVGQGIFFSHCEMLI
jgi:hypothetical protein